MEEELKQKELESEELKQEKKEPGLAEILKDHPAAPSPEQIEQWKAEFGEIFVSGFSEEELFIWKPLSRSEWINLQTEASDPKRKIDQFKFEEMVCDMCVIWKSTPDSFDRGKAGTPSSLHEQILQNSNFLSPQAASMLVVKL